MEAVAVLGINGTLPSALAYVDDTDVQFVSGRCIVRYDTETRQQNILHASANAAAITALAISPNKRNVAFAERSQDGGASVYMFDWTSKRRKKLGSADGVHSEIVYLSFTADGKTLLVQGSAPDSSMRMILWEKGTGRKVVGTIHCVPPSPGRTVAALHACPADSSLVAACGRGFLRLYRFLDGAFKTLAVNLKKDPANITTDFTCQLWLGEDWQVAGCSEGDLYLLRGGELVRILDSPPESGLGIMSGSGGPRPILCLAEYSKGFMVGCAGGVVRLYERTDEASMPYRCMRSMVLQETSAVSSLALSPTEEECVAITSRGQAFWIKVTAIELARQNIDDVAAANTRPLVGPLHVLPGQSGVDTSGPAGQTSAAAVLAAASGKRQGYQDIPLAEQGITGLSLCLRKPMFVTCGADKSVRVWNYAGHHLGLAGLSLAHGGEVAGVPAMEGQGAIAVTTPALELVQHMDETPSSVAMHPTGNMIAVGLATTLRLCSLVLGHNPPCLRTLKEYPIWQASDAVFSHGGGLLAVAAGTTITVLSPWTGASAAVLRGHTDRVVALAWSKDDKCLVSAGRDGSTIRWAIAVPNAAPGGGSGVVALNSIAGGPVPLPASASMDGVPHPARGGSASAASSQISAPALVGAIVGRVDVKDFYPLALVLGSHESGRDAIVSGAVSSAPAAVGALAGVKGLAGAAGSQVSYAPVTRHFVLDATSLASHPKEGGVRIADNKSGGDASAATATAGPEGSEEGVRETTRALALLHAAKIIVAGLGRRTVEPQAAKAAEDSADQPFTSDAPGTGSPPRGRSNHGGAGGSPTRATASPDRAEASRSAEANSTGAIRLSRLPAPGHSHAHAQADHAGSAKGGKAGGLGDLVYHAAPVLRIAVSRDEKLLITAAADGSIALWSVNDAALAERPSAAAASTSASAPGASTERLPLSDTILVAKADMDLLKRERAQLESKIAEVSVTNRKSEKFKLASNDSRVAELQAKFDAEVEAARAKTAELLNAKARMEQQAEAQIASLAASQARELAETETSYSAKLVAEIARYDKLVIERDQATVEARQGAQALASKQAQQIEELRAKYEAQIAEEEAVVAALEAERASIAAASVRAAHGLEADAEGEMANLRTRYEMRLAAESKATLLLRGENGFMKRKFVGINREISEQKEEMTALGEKEKELQDAIANLTKDVAGHKKEIREREETISDKDTRIYELKKKNQELEKFKFVLNYKIQELKRQIMPKKKEISDMREQLKEMEMELLQYHKSNAALDLMIGELKLKRDGIRRDVAGIEESVALVDESMARMARDLVAVAGAGKSHPQPSSVAAMKAVRSSMLQLYAKYIHGEGSGMKSAMAALGASLQAESKEGTLAIPPGVNVEELAEELARQRHHLEKNVESVQRKIAMDVKASETDKARLLRENTALTREVNDLRRDLRFLKADVAQVKHEAEVEVDVSRKAGTSSARGGSTLRRTGALQGVVSQSTTGGTMSQPLGIVVSVSKTLAS